LVNFSRSAVREELKAMQPSPGSLVTVAQR
jgi:hypothetical protein